MTAPRARRRPLSARLLPALTGVVVLAGCGAQGAASPAPAGGGRLTVFAAASLTNAFDGIGRRFEAAHPGTHVTFSYAGSTTLVTQLEEGAQADVFASADQASMNRAAADALLLGPARTFAHNSLEIAVAPGNPRHVAGLVDLARAGTSVVLCQSGVPCGSYARRALAAAGVALAPASEETDVRSVLTRVELGEADAGIVYTSDVRAAGSKVTGVQITAPFNVDADYPVGVMRAGHTALAATFVTFLEGPESQAILIGQGFVPPGGSPPGG